MRYLTSAEIQVPAGGDACIIISGLVLTSAVMMVPIILSKISCYCGWKPYVNEQSYFDYKWVCKDRDGTIV